MFVDASALVAIIRDEPGAASLVAAIEQQPRRIISGLAVWEAARALARIYKNGFAKGFEEVERYRQSYGITLVPIAAAEAREAFRAHVRFGKGTGHPARLNMGDCFAYACAMTNDARLLYKGNDFTHTDLA